MKIKKVLVAVATVAVGLAAFGTTTGRADSRKVVDLSEWQGTLTTTKAKKLKSEYQGVILRAQYGSTYKDRVFTHNAAVLKSVGMKYGAYSYSLYINANDAKQEAKDLYNRAPGAAFYVNDAEQYTVTSGSYSAATKAWGAEMQKLTNKPVVVYSGSYFFNTYVKTATNYNAKWIAAYGSTPATSYDMHQYTDALYSTSLGQSVDGNKSLSAKMQGYFKNGSTSKYTVGGRKANETVRVKKGATFYGSSSKIADSVAGKNLTIKQTKAVNTGKSKQVVLIYNGDAVIGWIRAQDVTAYYHSSTVHKLKVTNSKGVYTYHGSKRASFVKKGTTLAVSKFTKKSNGLWQAKHAGHKTTFTANKNYVKLVK